MRNFFTFVSTLLSVFAITNGFSAVIETQKLIQEKILVITKRDKDKDKIRTSLTLDEIQQVSSISPFTNSVHSGRFDYANRFDFGRYDTVFVQWLESTLLPSKTEGEYFQFTLKLLEQFPRLDVFLQDLIKTTCYVKNHYPNFKKRIRKYKRIIQQGMDYSPYIELGWEEEKEPISYAWLMRRYMDGTVNEFIKLIKQAANLYHPAQSTCLNQLADGGFSEKKRFSPLVTLFRRSKPFVTDSFIDVTRHLVHASQLGCRDRLIAAFRKTEVSFSKALLKKFCEEFAQDHYYALERVKNSVVWQPVNIDVVPDRVVTEVSTCATDQEAVVALALKIQPVAQPELLIADPAVEDLPPMKIYLDDELADYKRKHGNYPFGVNKIWSEKDKIPAYCEVDCRNSTTTNSYSRLWINYLGAKILLYEHKAYAAEVQVHSIMHADGNDDLVVVMVYGNWTHQGRKLVVVGRKGVEFEHNLAPAIEYSPGGC